MIAAWIELEDESVCVRPYLIGDRENPYGFRQLVQRGACVARGHAQRSSSVELLDVRPPDRAQPAETLLTRKRRRLIRPPVSSSSARF